MVVTVTVDTSLNGGTLDLTVYEDTDGDGTAENQETVTVKFSGAVTYVLDTLTGGTGNDYWVDVALNTSDVTKSPRVRSVSVDTSDERDAELTTDTTLNGGTVQVAVYEDTDADGTAENVSVRELSGGSGETNSLYGLVAGTGNDYWVRLDLTNSSVNDPPQVRSVAVDTVLAVTDSGTITTATGSSLTSAETATLTEAGTLTAGAATTTLTLVLSGTLTDDGSVTPAVGTVLTVDGDATLSDPAGVTTATAVTLDALETTLFTTPSELTNATATPLTTTVTLVISDDGSTVTAATTTLTTTEAALLTDAAGVITAISDVLTADEGTFATANPTLSSASAASLGADELTSASGGRPVEAAATVLSALETGTLTDAAALVAALGTPLTPSEVAVADDAGSVTAGVATPLRSPTSSESGIVHAAIRTAAGTLGVTDTDAVVDDRTTNAVVQNDAENDAVADDRLTAATVLETDNAPVVSGGNRTTVDANNDAVLSVHRRVAVGGYENSAEVLRHTSVTVLLTTGTQTG